MNSHGSRLAVVFFILVTNVAPNGQRCFDYPELRDQFNACEQILNCHWCGARSVRVLPLHAFGDYFRDVVAQLYQPDDHGEYVDELLLNDWPRILGRRFQRKSPEPRRSFLIAILKAGITEKELHTQGFDYTGFFSRKPSVLVDDWQEKIERIIQGDDSTSGEALHALRSDDDVPSRLEVALDDLAMSLSNLGRAEEAIANLNQMTARWPESSEVYTELGGDYVKLWRLQEALEATEKSLALHQYSTAAWNNLGGILANLQRFADAKSAYSKSLLIEPENTGAMIGLAQLHMADGELKEAKQLCELALFWRPEKTNVLKIVSECFLRCQDANRATPVLEKLVALDPEDAKAWFNLSLCRKTLGDAEGQVQALRQVLKLSPDDG